MWVRGRGFDAPGKSSLFASTGSRPGGCRCLGSFSCLQVLSSALLALSSFSSCRQASGEAAQALFPLLSVFFLSVSSCVETAASCETALFGTPFLEGLKRRLYTGDWCNERFLLIEERVPKFLKPHARDIHQAGMYIYILKSCHYTVSQAPGNTSLSLCTAVCMRGQILRLSPQAFNPLRSMSVYPSSASSSGWSL